MWRKSSGLKDPQTQPTNKSSCPTSVPNLTNALLNERAQILRHSPKDSQKNRRFYSKSILVCIVLKQEAQQPHIGVLAKLRPHTFGQIVSIKFCW